MENGEVKLNLGAGRQKKEGYVNVDIDPGAAPDVVWDLERFPWPWETNSIEEIEMRHVLEHVGQERETFFKIIQELYRVLVPDGVLNIWVPHPWSLEYISDPTHVRPITPEGMALFSKKINKDTQEKGWPNTPLGLMLDVDFEITGGEYLVAHLWKARSQTMSPEQFRSAMVTHNGVVSEYYISMKAIK